VDEFLLPILFVCVVAICVDFLMRKFWPAKYEEILEERERRFQMVGSLAKKCATPEALRLFVKFLKW